MAILSDNHAKVSVTSQLVETREAKLKLLERLVELGMLLKVLLEHVEFPSVSDIYERMAQEAFGNMALQAMHQGMGQPNPGIAPPDPNAPIPTPPPVGPDEAMV